MSFVHTVDDDDTDNACGLFLPTKYSHLTSDNENNILCEQKKNTNNMILLSLNFQFPKNGCATSI